MRDMSASAVMMGLLAAFVGYASSFTIVLAGLTAAGASEAQAATILAASTPAEQQAIASAVTESSKGTEVKVGDVIVDPATFGTAATATATLNKLPLSLKVLLVLLGLGSLTALGAVLIPRVRNYYRSR